LTHAQVPLIKATAVVRYAAQTAGEEDLVVTIPVDISMDGPRNTGITSTAMIKMLLAALPPMGPVFLLLKEFLKSKGLTNSYTGGLGSYGLLLMVLLPLLKQLRQVPSVPRVQGNKNASSSNQPSQQTLRRISPDMRGKFIKIENNNHKDEVDNSHVAEENEEEEKKLRKLRSISFSHNIPPPKVEVVEPAPARRKSTGSVPAPENSRWQNVQAQKDHGLRMGMMLVSSALGVTEEAPVARDAPGSSGEEPLLKLESPICGVVIEEFLRYYGEEMQCGAHGFSVREGGFRFDLVPDTDTKPHERTHPRAGDPLVIEDPIDVMSNVSHNCYRAVAIQKAFLDALDVFRGMTVRWDSRTFKAHPQAPRVTTPGNPEPIVRSRTSANVTALSRALSAALSATAVAAIDPHHNPLSASEQKTYATSSPAVLLEEMFCLKKLKTANDK